MKKIVTLGLIVAGPLMALAAADTYGTVGYIVSWLVDTVKYVVPVLMTIAIGYFIWGVIQFITASQEEAKAVGRTRIINGLIGLFVIVAFWGIIAVVQRTFGISAGGTVNNTNNILYTGDFYQD